MPGLLLSFARSEGRAGPAPTIARVIPSHEELVAELSELIAIPSISADPARAGDVRRAADWVVGRILAMGGTARIEERAGRPLVIGEQSASADPGAAPAILAYAHLDVQPADPLELWDSEPWTLVEREGMLVARGIADDKGHLFMLLKATELLAAAGELPVNVRFVLDAEEEVGGDSAVHWVAGDEGRVDAALVWDGGYVSDTQPAFVTALRGLCYFHLTVRTGARDLHSGSFGGAALNALHALVQTVSGVLARPDGRLPEALRVGVIAPSDDELAGWAALPDGDEELDNAGARPMDPTAARDFTLRTTSEPSAEINGIEGGSPRLQKTVLPVEAHANLSFRLAPGQRADEIAAVVERLLRESAPAGADVELELMASGDPAWVDPASPLLVLARDAFEESLGTRPVLVRSGGSIPIVGALADRGIPVIVGGFATPRAQIHSPNENLPAPALRTGVEATVHLLRRLADLA